MPAAQHCAPLFSQVCRLLFVARGGTWSPTTHHNLPDAFKAAARVLLLAGSRTGGTGSAASSAAGSAGGGGCRLPVLPDSVLLHIIQLAAGPMSAWL
jgi:hypothetical protein